MTWFVAGAGAVLILLVLRDMFHTLGHPAGQGELSRFVLRAVWRLTRRRGGAGRLSQLSGPLGMLSVIMLWGILAIVGWALVYWPSVPTGFSYASAPVPGPGGKTMDALYVSMVSMSTLGFGDIVPASVFLRIVNPLEALFGFALLTVAVSWVLQIYPALTRRRMLALRLSILRRTEVTLALDEPSSVLLPAVLNSLAVDIVQAGVDLRQYSETYYFRDLDDAASLASMLSYAVELGRVGTTAPSFDIRLAAHLLNHALDDLAQLLRVRFQTVGQTVPEIFAAYSAEQGHPLS